MAGVELWLVEWLVEPALDDGELPVEDGGELWVAWVGELWVAAGGGELTAEPVGEAAVVVGEVTLDPALELAAMPVVLATAVVP